MGRRRYSPLLCLIMSKDEKDREPEEVEKPLENAEDSMETKESEESEEISEFDDEQEEVEFDLEAQVEEAGVQVVEYAWQIIGEHRWAGDGQGAREAEMRLCQRKIDDQLLCIQRSAAAISLS